ncbi:restriction endonuclease subunit S domain-containing protein [Saccharomonospora saliphila]|uniref:restriction endonuclease subunit S n=1 Tax=Saccharomonospora saliphila TaxID=369829 RepID=UPI0012FBE567|nr:restriction endonuclease subunit S [Saccharomonospora saliphila]
MNLDLAKTDWKRVRLGDVIRRSRVQVDPASGSVERYVAGGHIDGDSVTIERWGDVDDGQMGSTFRYVFSPGQVLFVSARPYLRKVGVPDFEGVVADKTYVLDAVAENGLLQEFLPFILSSDRFVEYATAEATGSMNPRLLWGPMQRYEFDLPPLDEQKRLSDLLWAIERHERSVRFSVESAELIQARLRSNLFEKERNTVPAPDAFDITIGRQRSPRNQSGDHMVPYMRSANVTPDGIDLDNMKRMNFSPEEQEKFALKSGDVLVSEGSASAKSVGMPAVWRGELDQVVCFQNTLLRYRAVPDVTLPGFVEQWCRWAFETGEFRRASSGTNIHHIGTKGASAMKVGLPSIEEQARFLHDISTIGEAVAAASSESKSVAALRTAVSTQVFGGSG